MDFSAELLGQVAIDATGSSVVEYNGVHSTLGTFAASPMREAVVEFWKDGDKPTPR
jgi:hypothetical protein